VNALLAPSMRQSDTRVGAYSTLLAISGQQWASAEPGSADTATLA
jgi:hypothetical protein